MNGLSTRRLAVCSSSLQLYRPTYAPASRTMAFPQCYNNNAVMGRIVYGTYSLMYVVTWWSGARSVWQHGRFHVKRLDITQRHRGEIVVVVCNVVQRLCWCCDNWTSARRRTCRRHVFFRRHGGNLAVRLTLLKFSIIADECT